VGASDRLARFLLRTPIYRDLRPISLYAGGLLSLGDEDHPAASRD
jgi:hypothetical protein